LSAARAELLRTEHGAIAVGDQNALIVRVKRLACLRQRSLVRFIEGHINRGELLARFRERRHGRRKRLRRQSASIEVQGDIWLVSFMDYDLGYFDLETRVLEPLDNPFGPKLLPM
jgi:hypothetical protein